MAADAAKAHRPLIPSDTHRQQEAMCLLLFIFGGVVLRGHGCADRPTCTTAPRPKRCDRHAFTSASRAPGMRGPYSHGIGNCAGAGLRCWSQVDFRNLRAQNWCGEMGAPFVDPPRRIILAHLVRRFTDQTENLATEGVLFNLSSSAAARRTLVELAFADSPDVVLTRTRRTSAGSGRSTSH